MENKPFAYSENRSLFKKGFRKTIVCGFFAGVELIALKQTLTLPPDFWALTSLSLPLELIIHAAWVIAFSVGMALAWRNSVTWTQVMVFLSMYAMYTALHLALFVRADYDRQRLPFLLAGGCVFLLITLWMIIQERRTRARVTTVTQEVESEEDLKNGVKPQN